MYILYFANEWLCTLLDDQALFVDGFLLSVRTCKVSNALFPSSWQLCSLVSVVWHYVWTICFVSRPVPTILLCILPTAFFGRPCSEGRIAVCLLLIDASSCMQPPVPSLWRLVQTRVGLSSSVWCGVSPAFPDLLTILVSAAACWVQYVFLSLSYVMWLGVQPTHRWWWVLPWFGHVCDWEGCQLVACPYQWTAVRWAVKERAEHISDFVMPVCYFAALSSLWTCYCMSFYKHVSNKYFAQQLYGVLDDWLTILNIRLLSNAYFLLLTAQKNI